MEIPNLIERYDLENMGRDTKRCNTCQHFVPCAMSDPAGWCQKYPSPKVNTAAPFVCDDYCRKVR